MNIRHSAQTTSPAVATLDNAGARSARRLAFILPVVALTMTGTALAAYATNDSEDPLRIPLLALLAVFIFLSALGGWPPVLGFLVRVCGRSMHLQAEPSGLVRTAVVMPVHEEDPRTVFAAIGSMASSIFGAGLTGVDLFVLSDTRTPDGIQAEREAHESLLARLPPNFPAVHYRVRESNAGRKAGNIAEFCRGRGAGYELMVVLDADSVMGGRAIGNLIGLMEANPGTGIIQTVPWPVGRGTLFARLQQFSARLYGPALVEGLTFWQGADGNYWGHNAIVRIAPFMEHCGLPVLPGPEPFGGEILCHDVVEAGLMRGAGWGVWVLPQVEESYESLPANMPDSAGRERRWCQGNLQHTAVLRHPDLRTMGRYHLAYGISNYASAPLALSLAALATTDGVLGGTAAAELASCRGVAGTALVILVACLLWGGKALCLGATLADRSASTGFGGRARLLAAAALEQVYCLISSPLSTVLACGWVSDVFRGRSVRWDPQPRDDRGVGWDEALPLYGWTVPAGVAWIAALAISPPALLPWLAPAAAGLLLSVPAVVWSSRVSAGMAARRAGLFMTPEETNQPAVLAAAIP